MAHGDAVVPATRDWPWSPFWEFESEGEAWQWLARVKKVGQWSVQPVGTRPKLGLKPREVHTVKRDRKAKQPETEEPACDEYRSHLGG